VSSSAAKGSSASKASSISKAKWSNIRIIACMTLDEFLLQSLATRHCWIATCIAVP
jgi:hypothetical protein